MDKNEWLSRAYPTFFLQYAINTNFHVLVGFADAKAAITPDIQMLVNPISTTNTDVFAAMGVRV